MVKVNAAPPFAEGIRNRRVRSDDGQNQRGLMTDEETENYTENVRVALGQALFSLSADGRTLPLEDEVFVPTLIGVMRGLSSLAAARLVGGGPVELDGLGAALGREFAETARQLEAVFRQVQEQEGKAAN